MMKRKMRKCLKDSFLDNFHFVNKMNHIEELKMRQEADKRFMWQIEFVKCVEEIDNFGLEYKGKLKKVRGPGWISWLRGRNHWRDPFA